MWAIDPLDIKYRFHQNVFHWSEALTLCFGELLQILDYSPLLTSSSFQFYRPIISRLVELSETYGVNEVPMNLISLIESCSRPDSDLSLGREKQRVIHALDDHDFTAKREVFNLIAQVLSKESLPVILQQDDWDHTSLQRHNGITPMCDLSSIPLTEYIFDTEGDLREWVMDADYVRHHVTNKLTDRLMSKHALKMFLLYFRDSLDKKQFSYRDLIQYSLTTDLLYINLELRRLTEIHGDVNDTILDRLRDIILLVTTGVENVCF